MPKIATPITAVVEVIAGLKEGNYGPYRSVLFKSGPNDSDKIWQTFKPDADELACLRKGMQVQLIPTTNKDGKTSYAIVLLDQAPQATPPRPRPQQAQAEPQQLPPAAGMSPEMKRAIAAYVNEQGDLLAFCWAVAEEKLNTEDREVSEESVRCAASTLFISAQRKFHV